LDLEHDGVSEANGKHVLIRYRSLAPASLIDTTRPKSRRAIKTACDYHESNASNAFIILYLLLSSRAAIKTLSPHASFVFLRIAIAIDTNGAVNEVCLYYLIR